MAKQKKVPSVANKSVVSSRKASGVFSTKRGAIAAARKMAKEQRADEVVVHDSHRRVPERHSHGKDSYPIRDKGDVIGKDPSPSRDKNGVTKIRKIGSSRGVILSQEVLDSLNLKEGDEMFVLRTPDGVKLTPYDPKFAQVMKFARDFMRRYRDDMRELAK